MNRGGSDLATRDHPPPWRSVLAVVAHPDDESFGLGAVLAGFVDAGAAVAVLCFTHGESSTLHGWIHADRTTLATGFEGVYAIGDNTHIVLGIGKPLPRAGVFAHGQAHVVADTIAADITGKPAPAGFDGHGGCFIETGTGRAAYGSGNFYGDPAPTVAMHSPARRWHWGKVAFEQRVMRRWL